MQHLMILRFMILGAFLFGMYSSLFSETIRLKNGEQYEDTVVLERTPEKWRVRTSFGTVEIPVGTIMTVDGEPLENPDAIEPPLPQPMETSGQEADLSGQVEGIPGENEQAEPEVEGEPDADPPGADAAEEPGAGEPVLDAATPEPLPEYRRDSRFDLLLGIAAGIFLLWVAQMVWVQKDLLERSRSATGWNTLVALLPGIGFLLYLVARNFQKPGGSAAQNKALLQNEGVFSQGGREKQSINLQFLEDDRSVFGAKLQEGSGIETAKRMLEDAIVHRASDIHIEPQEAIYRIRFRIDGVLVERPGLTKNEGIRVVSALKTLALIDVAEKRKAQDGRFRVRTDIRDVDFRVATATAIFGEKLVIRILDRKGGLFDLSDVGMEPEMMDRFHRAIHSRAGMIIATGPTGSGKTSTLYAALSKLDAGKLNIMTIEDPAEYELPGATQIPVNVKAGVTYEGGLRSILRQDPDVIFVGEMRDAEAAKIAIRAALTGHLVFTTLHTKDSLATVIRLEEMGVERSQLSSGLLMLVAQRLVRVLCEHCREKYQSKGDELLELNMEIPEGADLYRPVGCAECSGTGYLGRTGVFELVILDDALRAAVGSGAGHEELLAMARERGFKGYREHAAEKALLGVTSIEEVLEAT